MSETKWTPRPWKRNGSWILSDKQDIAQMFTSNCTANGDLIAAAPDLYAALEEVEWADYGKCPQCGRSPHQPACMLNNTLRKARGEAA